MPNGQDQCPETPLGALVNPQGCSIEQICPCDTGSHEAYVECVRSAARAFQDAGLINNARRRQLVENARAANCPPSSGGGDGIIFGLPHRSINFAQLDFQPEWFMGLSVVPEEGNPDDTYGVSIGLGEADSGVFIYPDGNWGNYGENWFWDARAYGEQNELVSSVHVRKPNYEYYPVEVGLASLQPESVTIQVLSNDVVLAETVADGSGASFSVTGSKYLEPRGNPYWRMPDGSVGVLIEFMSPSVFQHEYGWGFSINGPFGEDFRGNRIFVRANNPRRTARHITRVDAIAGGGVPGFQITNERLGMFGHAHQALGPVAFGAGSGRLRIEALEPPGQEDFAGVLVEAPGAASQLELDFEPVPLEETGSGLVFYLSGAMDADGVMFSEMRITRELDEVALRFDFQALFGRTSSNAPGVQAQVLRNGRLAGSAIFPGAVAVGTVALRDGQAPEVTGCRATINSNGVPTMGLSFARTVTFKEPDGAELRGNHIRLTPLNASSPVRSMSSIAVEMMGHESITITAERSTPAPPALTIQASGNELVVSWQEATGLYGLESASAVTGPFEALTNEVELLEGRHVVRLPKAAAGRFFRLMSVAE